jgi:hypothetical protein
VSTVTTTVLPTVRQPKIMTVQAAVVEPDAGLKTADGDGGPGEVAGLVNSVEPGVVGNGRRSAWEIGTKAVENGEGRQVTENNEWVSTCAPCVEAARFGDGLPPWVACIYFGSQHPVKQKVNPTKCSLVRFPPLPSRHPFATCDSLVCTSVHQCRVHCLSFGCAWWTAGMFGPLAGQAVLNYRESAQLD